MEAYQTKHISDLRRYAAQRHASVPQMYDPDVPYWVHLFIVELFGIAFNLGPRVRRIIIGHDLGEDTAATHKDLRIAGWSSEEVGDISRLTDLDGPTRAARKEITLPMVAQGGFNAIAAKACDRGGNYLYGLLSGSVRSHTRY